MIQFGMPLGFAGFSYPSVQNNAAQNPANTQNLAASTTQPAAASHTTANVTAQGGHSMGMYGVAMMSPAYMMAYPQMTGPAMNMPSGMAAQHAEGGHVTANPTNAIATPNAAAAGGYGAFGGVGMYGMAMPMMVMAPVLMAVGYPVVFQGSVAQPPVADAQTKSTAVEPPPTPVETPVVDIPDPVSPPPVDTDGVTIDVVPQAETQSPTLPNLPITELGAEDFAKYRLVEKDRQQETQLSLSLTTQDGDKISLNFSQLDTMEMSRFSGQTLDGERVKDSSFREASDRVVNMDVVGDLSAEEKAAVDSVLSTIIEAVNKFFTGDVGDAVAKLKQMDFDGQQLAELSLNMSMSKSADVTKAYHNGDNYLHDLKNRDADVNQALEFLASEQKRLIDVAKGFFDAPSAAKLVRSLVPPMLSEPFAQLREQVATNELVEAANSSEDASDAAPADKEQIS